MEKLYVNEIAPDGAINTVGLFYSRGEAENIIARLKAIPERAECHYEVVEAVADAASTNPPKQGILIQLT